MDTTALIYKVLCAHNGSFELGELCANICTTEDDLETVLGNPEMFTRTVYKSKQIIIARTKMRLCKAKRCNDCSNLHVCKFYLYGTCPSNERQGCSLSHELTSQHNNRVLREHHLDQLDRRELCTLLLQNDNHLLPPICFNYNKTGGKYGYCPDKESCRRLHICQRYITGTCAAEVDCDKSHDFYEPHPLSTLQNGGVPSGLVPSMLSTYRNINAIRDRNDTNETTHCKTSSGDQLQHVKALPSHWDKSSMPETGYKRVALQRSSDEFQKMLNCFHLSMTGFSVQTIERVQNQVMWEAFQWKGDVMRETKAGMENEMQLFYGTDSQHVDTICLQNIDWKMQGKHLMPYGIGSYFSRDAKYSHRFTSQSELRSMFVCRVMVGNYKQGHSSYVHPPLKDRGHPTFSYDSYVDDIYNPSVFVVLGGKHQVYPEYLIQYRHGSRPGTYAPHSKSIANQTQYIHWQTNPFMLQSQATPVWPKTEQFKYPGGTQPIPTHSTQPHTLFPQPSSPAGLLPNHFIEYHSRNGASRPTLTHASAMFGSLNALAQSPFNQGLGIYQPHPPPCLMKSGSRAPPPSRRKSQFAELKAKSKSMASLDNL